MTAQTVKKDFLNDKCENFSMKEKKYELIPLSEKEDKVFSSIKPMNFDQLVKALEEINLYK